MKSRNERENLGREFGEGFYIPRNETMSKESLKKEGIEELPNVYVSVCVFVYIHV